MTAADGDRIGSQGHQGQSGGDSQADQLNHEMTRQQTHDAVREFGSKILEAIARQDATRTAEQASSQMSADGAGARALQERGRELAIQVQDELGTDGWEVLYQMDGQMLRVHPPGSWPVESWEQELLGYHRRSPAERTE